MAVLHDHESWAGGKVAHVVSVNALGSSLSLTLQSKDATRVSITLDAAEVAEVAKPLMLARGNAAKAATLEGARERAPVRQSGFVTTVGDCEVKPARKQGVFIVRKGGRAIGRVNGYERAVAYAASASAGI